VPVKRRGQLPAQDIVAEEGVEPGNTNFLYVKTVAPPGIKPGQYILKLEAEDLFASPTDSKRRLSVLAPIKINKKL
jgi:hypothetical protein